MTDAHYPTVDIDFIENLIIKSPKIIPNSLIKVNNTRGYVLVGKNAISKRLILIREIDKNQMSFEHASALAWKFNFMGDLLKWLVDNRNWKDGGYFEGTN